MKISYLTHQYDLNGIYSGVDYYLSSIIRHIGLQEKVSVYSGHHQRYKKPGVITAQSMAGFELTRVSSILNHPVNDKVMCNAFRQYLEKAKPDIVHINHLLGLSDKLPLILAQKSIPFVFTIWDFYDIQLWKNAVKGASLILAPSAYAQKRLLREYPEAKEKIEVLTPGIEKYQNTIGRKSNIMNIGYFGAVYPRKGIFNLIKAVKALPKNKFKLHIFGNTSHKQRWLKLLFSGYYRSYYGPYKHDNFTKLLKSIDVVVIPSLLDETFCFVLHETLSAGIPVIASTKGALPETMNSSKNGYLFNPENIVELTEIIKNFQVFTPQYRPKMTPSEHAQELLKKYKFVLAKHISL